MQQLPDPAPQQSPQVPVSFCLQITGMHDACRKADEPLQAWQLVEERPHDKDLAPFSEMF